MNRSLWRLKSDADRRAYIRRHLTQDIADMIVGVVEQYVQYKDVTADGKPPMSPKHVHAHTARVRFLLVPIEERHENPVV